MFKPRLLTKKDTYTVDYPEAVSFAERQNSIYWTDSEIDVSKDIQDIKVNMTESEAHGVVTTLKLFTLYELQAGNEYWGGRVKRLFPRPADIQRMANSFSFFELNVHAPFYNKLNEALHLNTDSFYSEYVNDPILKDRMDFIDRVVSDKDPLLSLGVFSMVEGAILYSSFAYLKHFQSEGKNKLLNVVRGINFSTRDEALHSEGGAWLFQTLKKEMNQPQEQDDLLHKRILDCAEQILQHETYVVQKIFEKGSIEGITDHQLVNFVKSRINVCLQQLGYPKLYEVSYNPIAKWFYKGINTVQFHDFFTGVGNSYNRDWDETKFTF